MNARKTPDSTPATPGHRARSRRVTRGAVLRLAVTLYAGIGLSGCTALIVTGAVVGTAAATAGAVVSTGVGAVTGAVKGAASVFSDDEE